VASREAAIEALTGAHLGRVLSCEIIAHRAPTPWHVAFLTAAPPTGHCRLPLPVVAETPILVMSFAAP